MLQLDDSVWASMVARARRHHVHVAARIYLLRSTTRQPGLGSGQLLRIKVDSGSEYGTDGTDSGKVPYRRKIPGAPQEPPDGIEGTYGTGGTELARGAQFRTFDEL